MRLIDGDYLYDELKSNGIENMYLGSEVLKMVKEEPTIEAIPKADYEARLKADMVAMLTDIQLEIEEIDLKDSDPNYQKGAEEVREYISNMIEERIDKLKEAKDGENSIGDNPCGNC